MERGHVRGKRGAETVGAVVVTYHPDQDVAGNLRLLRAQVETVVVVDNGSPEASLQSLREACTSLALHLVENGENLGIATALNGGVKQLRGMGCTLAVLFDQDSTITEGYLQTMMRCFTAAPASKRLAILVPRYVDSRFANTLAPPVSSDGSLEAATTSGSMMPLPIFEAIGWFAEELFIDGVDYEYSLRVRRAGYTIAECPEAVLLHSPGTPTYHRIFGKSTIQAANYSPVRRYYQERNKIWVAKRYVLTFPGFCARQFLTSLKDLVKILLFEQVKGRKIRFFFLGIWHGLLGRTGRLDD